MAEGRREVRVNKAVGGKGDGAEVVHAVGQIDLCARGGRWENIEGVGEAV